MAPAPLHRARRLRRILLSGLAAVLSIIVLAAYAAWSPTCTWYGKVHVSLPAVTEGNAARRIALTFDDGPDPRVTPRILAILAEHGAKATFFFCGERVARHPELVAATIAGGHAIGNHTYTHRALPLLPVAEITQELVSTTEALRAASPATLGPVRFFRPPYGLRDPRVLSTARDLGMQTVLWSASPRDWQSPEPDEIVARVLADARDGAIVLLHDGDARADAGRPNTAEALPGILTGLRERGFECVGLDDVLGGG